MRVAIAELRVAHRRERIARGGEPRCARKGGEIRHRWEKVEVHARLGARGNRSACEGRGSGGRDARASATAKSEVPFGGELGIRVDDDRARHAELRREVASGGDWRAGAQRSGADRLPEL